ncbi:envelope glycoprotein D [Equid herpesvirus 6]|uniref:Envelope glycoprotein D n=1 Tax=Equid herpesvirus 6 TaxID=173566 RepID=A0A7S9VM92_9ALPH|nr:envelope glycoprotein D [Equid herpesvirus 6]QPI70183.1 envelope glycoprotein D [Equid herpesvirus 6]
MTAAGASIAGLGLLLALLSRPAAGAPGVNREGREFLDLDHPIAKLKHVPWPKFPPPRYNYTVSNKFEFAAISPFSDDPSHNTDVRHVVSTKPCEMFGLIATPHIDHILKELELNGRRYTARVSWYRIMEDCAIPLHDILYADCDPQKPFGICDTRSANLWLSSISQYVVDTPDELNLIMAAPPPGTTGQYRRVVRIEDKLWYTDFMVSIPDEPCPTSIATEFGKYGVCVTPEEYAAGTVDTRELLVRERHQPSQSVWVYHLFKERWGVPPEYFPESPTYARPSRPEAHPGSSHAPDMPGAGPSRPHPEPPHPEESPPTDTPEDWPPLDNLTPKLERDDVSSSNGGAGARPGVVVAAVAAVLAVLALTCASAYFCCLRKRWGVSKLPLVGGVGAPPTYKDVRYERLY